MMLGILCLVLAYIAGSFPSGLVIGKTLYHTDPREYGSHNTGATNAYRVFGAAGGLLVLICDVAKGMLGVYLGQVASQMGLGSADTQIYFMIAGGLLAIIGHSCSIFLKFKGGKGVATGLGIILFLAPWETLIVFFLRLGCHRRLDAHRLPRFHRSGHLGPHYHVLFQRTPAADDFRPAGSSAGRRAPQR